MKKHGFTLAEVLVALGIVGVVAAIAIPAFTTNANNKINAVKLSKVVSDYENIFGTMMLTENKTNLADTEFGKAILKQKSDDIKSALSKYAKIERAETTMNGLGYVAYMPNLYGAALAAVNNDEGNGGSLGPIYSEFEEYPDGTRTGPNGSGGYGGGSSSSGSSSSSSSSSSSGWSSSSSSSSGSSSSGWGSSSGSSSSSSSSGNPSGSSSSSSSSGSSSSSSGSSSSGGGSIPKQNSGDGLTSLDLGDTTEASNDLPDPTPPTPEGPGINPNGPQQPDPNPNGSIDGNQGTVAAGGDPGNTSIPSGSGQNNDNTTSSGTSTGNVFKNIHNKSGNFEFVSAIVTGTGETVFFVGDTSKATESDSWNEKTSAEKGINCARKLTTIVIDVNGTEMPNKYGRDVFAFTLGSDGKLYPYGSKTASYMSNNSTKTWKDNDTMSGCKSGNYSGFGCTARLIENGYKIDY